MGGVEDEELVPKETIEGISRSSVPVITTSFAAGGTGGSPEDEMDEFSVDDIEDDLPILASLRR